jgi:phage terminase large subunit-like protein
MIGDVDFMLWGGARFGGKSEILSMIPCCFAEDKSFRGIFFRRQYDEIMGANGLWEKGENQYPLFGAQPKISDKAWVWPSGAKQFYRHMFYEDDKSSHRGKGYSLIGFDEIDQFSKSQVTFLMTCLRSEADMNSFCVGTLNPNPDSWCLPLVEYYLKEDGSPDPDKRGDIRWFIVKEGEFIFGPSEEWFQENYPECLWVDIPNSDETIYIRPKKFTYFFFNIFDNPLGLKANPVYLSELNNLPDHERDTQLWGNWYSRPRSQSLWQRHWLRGEAGEKVSSLADIPPDLKWYRGTDKGYSEPSEVYAQPDFTATSPKIAKDRNGEYWLIGDYLDDYTDVQQLKLDAKERVHGRMRKLAGARDSMLIRQAHHDGDDTTWVFTKDTGGAATDHYYTLGRFQEEGLKVKEDKSAHNTPNKKLVAFQPFCQACSLGLVHIVESTFDKPTLNALYSELEAFDPEKKSNSARKDDWVDAMSMAFAAACSGRTVNIVTRNQQQNESRAANVIDSYTATLQETPKYKES